MWKLTLSILTAILVFYVSLSYGNDPAGRNAAAGDLVIDTYLPAQACNGTTLFPDLYNKRIIEMDMWGNVIWEFAIPDDFQPFTEPGFEAELLDDDHLLIGYSRKGVYEIDRDGNVVWHHDDPEISHDVDRLSNGDTLYVYGAMDRKEDRQVKVVDSSGASVWSWEAKTEFDVPPYEDIFEDGWTHTNGAVRMGDGNTLISLRNFQLSTIVDQNGLVVRNIDWASLFGVSKVAPHDPEVLSNGNILVALQQQSPYQGVEYDPDSQEIIWSYYRSGLRTTRDANRLSNGNTLLVSVLTDDQESVIFEVTPGGEIVWQLRLNGISAQGQPGFFYKAQRLAKSFQLRDFNRDGHCDVLYRHPTTGDIGVWLMNGVSEAIWKYIGRHDDWDIGGVGDFDGDEQNDIVFRHPEGDVGVWLMTGLTETTWRLIDNHGDWEIRGTGDFNSDNQADIIYRHPTTGNIGVWLMNGVSQTSWQYIGNHGIDWDIKGVSDLNGDGRADIVYRHPTTGAIGVWLMNGAAETAWQYIGNHGVDWDIRGAGDFNDDGHYDILYRNPTTGKIGVWLMNGVTETTWTYIGAHDSWDIR